MNNPCSSTVSTVEYCMCLTTAPNNSTAQQIAQSLLQQKLVACVNVSGKMTSLYHWNDEIVCDEEVQLMMKTSVDKLPLLQKSLLQLHPYDVPEFIVLEIKDGLPEYLQWMKDVLRG